MARCEWCHEPFGEHGGPLAAPGPGMAGSWCQRCTDEYHAWPADAQKFPSGVLPGCVDDATGRAKLLFGLEKSGKWCHPQGNADPGDRDNVMAACREAAEETCFGLGPPRHLKVSYFDGGKATGVFGGCWIIDLGRLSAEQQQGIVTKHASNKSGALWRKPHHCEVEMRELRWCDAQEFLSALEEGHLSGAKHLSLPSLGGAPFRSWTTKYYLSLRKCTPFRAFCTQKGWGSHKKAGSGVGGAATSKADEGALLHELLDVAKAEGSDPGAWEHILSQLSGAKGLVSKTAGRSFSLLHHAAFWGQSEAATRLVLDFRADAQLRSRDGKTPADVAAERGHPDLADFLASSLRSQLVDSVLSLAKHKGAQAGAWEEIFKRLADLPSVVDERNGRSYSLLHHAAYWGRTQAVRRLVDDFHADVCLRAKDGLTAAEIAGAQGHPELAEYLSKAVLSA